MTIPKEIYYRTIFRLYVRKLNKWYNYSATKHFLLIKMHPMIFTTTNTIEGKRITQYLGVISADVIIGANIFSDIFAGVRDIVGGRSATYEKKFSEGKKIAMSELEAEARALGGDAIVGIDYDFETIGGKGSMLMISITGTAVKTQ